ncbi:MAG: NAD-dependent epimerase/dehydratase family protein [Bacteroidia bacterium]
MENKHNVLVLGGAGYIGTTLAPYLQDNNCNVTVVDTNWFGNYLPPHINTIQKDIFDLHLSDLVGFDTVIFLAGLSNDPMAEFSPKDNFIYNTGMPAYIGFLAKEAGVKRFIFASSCSVYGYTHNSTFTEEDVAISNYPYGVSKLQGERSLLALADENFSVVCFRQGTVSGYSPRMRLDLALNTMFKNALSKGEITLSNPKIWRPILGLNDLCDAYLLAINSNLQKGEVINISSFNTTIGELAHEIKSFIQQQYGLEIKITNQNVQDYRNYKVSTDKALQLLNYKPKQDAYSIMLDLHDTVDQYSSFNDERFYNILVFKKIMMSQLITN